MPQISEHFTLAEAERSDTAERLEIDNSVPVGLLPIVGITAEKILEPVREHFNTPFSPTSFYRCEALERVLCKRSYARWCRKRDMAVGDDSWQKYFENKQHPMGRVADFIVPGVGLLIVAKWIKDRLEFDQLILEYYSPAKGRGWVHCSYNAGDNRGQVLTMGPGGPKEGLP